MTHPGVCRHGGLRRSCETCDLAERLKQAEAERDEARYCARILEHAYQHDTRPPYIILQSIRLWPPVTARVDADGRPVIALRVSDQADGASGDD